VIGAREARAPSMPGNLPALLVPAFVRAERTTGGRGCPPAAPVNVQPLPLCRQTAASATPQLSAHLGGSLKSGGRRKRRPQVWTADRPGGNWSPRERPLAQQPRPAALAPANGHPSWWWNAEKLSSSVALEGRRRAQGGSGRCRCLAGGPRPRACYSAIGGQPAEMAGKPALNR